MNNIEISLKGYLFDQEVVKNHYPFKYWISNKNLFINVVFWSWIGWWIMVLFAILLPIDNQQKLSRQSVIVFESAFQYIVKLLKKHHTIQEDSSVNTSPSNWNYEAYIFLYLTIFLLIISSYCVYVIKNFLRKLKEILSDNLFDKKITRLIDTLNVLWISGSIIMIWTSFSLLYMEKPNSVDDISTLLFKAQDSTVSGSSEKIYHKTLTKTGIVTLAINLLIVFPIVFLYFKQFRELFVGNYFFFKKLRIVGQNTQSVARDPHLKEAILNSMNIKSGNDFFVKNDPGYIVQLENVNKYFSVVGGYFHALKNINLKIKRGEFIVILGYSGSGKTTLLNILSGIDRPTTGRCVIDDCNTTIMSDSELNLFRRKKIGYIFQNYALLPNLTASENIAITHGLGGDSKIYKNKVVDLIKILREPVDFYKKTKLLINLFKNSFISKTNKEELNFLMEALDLIEHKSKYPHHLSGGQQQRVAITRAIIKKPKILLADEPTGAIDHSMTKSILELFYNINEYAKTTVIVITHNPLIAKMAKRILYVSDGEIVNDVINENPQHPKNIKGL